MGRNRIELLKQSTAFASGDQHSPAANTAAVVTYAAKAGVSHVVTGFHATVSAPGGPMAAAPTVKVEDASGTVVFEQALSADVGVAATTTVYLLDVKFVHPKRGTTGNALIVTIPAQGSGNLGKLSVYDHWTEVA